MDDRKRKDVCSECGRFDVNCKCSEPPDPIRAAVEEWWSDYPEDSFTQQDLINLIRREVERERERVIGKIVDDLPNILRKIEQLVRQGGKHG